MRDEAELDPLVMFSSSTNFKLVCDDERASKLTIWRNDEEGEEDTRG